jgi:hypothetical protein
MSGVDGKVSWVTLTGGGRDKIKNRGKKGTKWHLVANTSTFGDFKDTC